MQNLGFYRHVWLLMELDTANMGKEHLSFTHFIVDHTLFVNKLFLLPDPVIIDYVSCGNVLLRRVYYPSVVFLKVRQMRLVVGVTFCRRIWEATHVDEG